MGNAKRLHHFELLEPRNMFAGDCGRLSLVSQVEALSASVDHAEESLHKTQSLSGVLRVSETSPGTTSLTLVPVSNVSRQLTGHLWMGNPVDTYSLQVDRASNFVAKLSGLSRSAGMILSDRNGLLVLSRNAGAASKATLSAELGPGSYYLLIYSQSLFGTKYALDLSLVARVTSPPPPVNSPAPISNPVLTPTKPTSPPATPSHSVPANPPKQIQPLVEVPYVGTSQEYGFNKLGAPEAWNAGYTGQGVTVAVVDTGIDLNHPDLVQNIFVNPSEIPGNGKDDDGNGYIDDLRGYDFVDGDNDPSDLNGHGTHVAGTIAAVRNNIGTTGVAPDAKILPVRVLDRNGSGRDSAVAAGIRYAARVGANIINLSLGGSYSSVIKAAIDYAQSLGSFVVVASGNESSVTPGYPARFSSTDAGVLSVGAINFWNERASFSNGVGNSGAVQVDAPGVNIYSTYLNGSYSTLSGTSMATPHIAGLAALILSANSSLKPAEVRKLITTSTTSTAQGSDSIGIADARTAVAYAAAGLRTSPDSGTQSSGRAVASDSVSTRGLSAMENLSMAPVAEPNGIDANAISEKIVDSRTVTVNNTKSSPFSGPLLVPAVSRVLSFVHDQILADWQSPEESRDQEEIPDSVIDSFRIRSLPFENRSRISVLSGNS